MKVFIFEHVCGGGMATQRVSGELAVQGSAMLRAAIEDFAALDAQVVTTLDQRLGLDLGDCRIEPVTTRTNLRHLFDTIAASADAVLVIAPEIDGILPGWLRRVQRAGARSLNADPRAAALCGDKLLLARRLAQAGVRTPNTQALALDAPLPCPLIVKPRCGVGCEQTLLVTQREQLAKLPPGDWIAQPKQHGMAASGSAIVHGQGRMTLLPPGEQRVVMGPVLRYEGGRIGLPPALAERAMAMTHAAITAVAGLRGFVGVDLILGHDDPALDCVIEINPRLTLSYCGLRSVCDANLAAAMLDDSVEPMWSGQAVQFDAMGRVAEPVA